MNTPSNYKELEAFAKSINLDVKYLLGEKYEGNLDLSSLTSLPENFNVTVGGYLDLGSVTSIPENFNVTVGGSLYLNSLKTIQENFNVTVGGYLDLGSLKSLPENYKISLKGDLYIDDNKVSTKVIYKKLDSDSIIVYEGTNYIRVDGIFCEVIQNHEGIKKCRKINSTKEFYIVSSNGKHSHGETIEEARKDLIYKITNRDKSSYKGLKSDSKLSFGEAVECYRVITGACFFGTKNFIETYKVPEKDYTINEIIKLTSNQYGGSTFKEFFQNT